MKTVPFQNPHDQIPAAIAEAAAAWLARRDRGLSPAEQDEYLQWLRADPRHTEAVTQHAAALERMMQLYEWQPSHDTEPNPDLFAPPRRQPWLVWSGALAAAAVLAVIFLLERPWSREAPMVAAAPKSYLHVNERLALPDGSRVELKNGTQLVVQYSQSARRVKLIGGEANFSVWKDRARPFVVDVEGVLVRAVGTAFNVRLGADAVQVLVTEGQVEVGQASAPEAAPVLVSTGEQVTVTLGTPLGPVIAPVTAEDIARELAWQAPRLQFIETPLAEAVGEFNRLNHHQIGIGDRSLGQLRIGGTFRPDNVEGFLRLLADDPALGVRLEPDGPGRTILRRVP